MKLLISEKYNKLYISWLITLISLIILMIIVGGLTRLTDSGLSITRWQLFSGFLPPLNNEDWIFYFNLYKQIPEYKLQNFSMTMNEFKIIFWWEWAHRFLGRIVGLATLIPLIYFSFIFKIKDLINIYIIFFLICFQGFIGWYMVSSGLVDRVDVSHYRLSIHLFVAFLILTCLFWNVLNFKDGNNKKFFSNSSNFYSIKILIILTFLQIIFGAFVSGLDAGRIYQTWPSMNGSFIPNDIDIKNFSEFFNFDNRSIVQFIHRNLAYIILIFIIYIGYSIRKIHQSELYKPYFYLLFFVFLQIFLGILTLISNLNMIIASAHQISSIFLIIFCINLYHKSIN
tara:strand:- start:568 stop:1590 length:1023 start_codon:yes stop_codon:yes gene_type:complete